MTESFRLSTFGETGFHGSLGCMMQTNSFRAEFLKTQAVMSGSSRGPSNHSRCTVASAVGRLVFLAKDTWMLRQKSGL
jgi:hypothetical protein